MGKSLFRFIIGQRSWNSTSSRFQTSKSSTISDFLKTNLGNFILNCTAHLLNNLCNSWRTPPFCHPPCFHPRSIPKDYPKNESSICTERSVSFASLEWKIWLPRRLENKTVLLRTPALLCTSQGKILQVECSTLHSAGSTKTAPLGATTCNKCHDQHWVYNVYPIWPIAQITYSNLDQNAR